MAEARAAVSPKWDMLRGKVPVDIWNLRKGTIKQASVSVMLVCSIDFVRHVYGTCISVSRLLQSEENVPEAYLDQQGGHRPDTIEIDLRCEDCAIA